MVGLYASFGNGRVDKIRPGPGKGWQPTANGEPVVRPARRLSSQDTGKMLEFASYSFGRTKLIRQKGEILWLK